MKKRRQSVSRIRLVLWVCYGIGALLLVRIFALQVIRPSGADTSRLRGIEITRGELFAVDGPDEQSRAPIAVNEEFFLLYAEPFKITDPVGIARELSPAVGIPEEEIRKKIADVRDIYVPLKHYVPAMERDLILSLALDGIGFSSELKRLYPARESLAHVTGFVGFSDDRKVGQYGLEGRYEELLSASDSVERDRRGQSLVITINKTVQERVCAILRDGVTATEAIGGVVVIMDPFTGDVKALCAVPSYDPNAYGQADAVLFVNPAISVAYEPGSVYKPITLASALDVGAITPSTTFTDTGSVTFGKFTIRNAENKIYGLVSMTEVLEESINTGVMFAVQKMGVETFLHYTRQFGFGSRTGIDLSGEGAGTIASLEKKKDIYAATASFGQGITVTPVQLARAFAALANGGTLVTPRIAAAVITESGEQKLALVEEQRRQVISPQTSSVISAMLASVVVSGHSKGSRIPGYFIAGKTGTAQVANTGSAESGYSADTIHSYAGFFPLKQPRFVVVVKIEKPKKGSYAESTAVPVFRSIAQFLIQYYKIPPERNTE